MLRRAMEFSQGYITANTKNIAACRGSHQISKAKKTQNKQGKEQGTGSTKFKSTTSKQEQATAAVDATWPSSRGRSSKMQMLI